MTIIRNGKELLMHNDNIRRHLLRGSLTPEHAAKQIQENEGRLVWWERLDEEARAAFNSMFPLPS